MHHTIEITVPGQATGALLAELGKLDGVLTLSAGDVVTVQALNREVDAVLALAAEAQQHGHVTVSTGELQSLIDPAAVRAIDDDADEAPGRKSSAPCATTAG